MANFCGKCGTRIDVLTGLCPNCDKEQINAAASAAPVMPVAPAEAPVSVPPATPQTVLNAVPEATIAGADLNEEIPEQNQTEVTNTEIPETQAEEAVEDNAQYVPAQEFVSAEENVYFQVAPQNALTEKAKRKGSKALAVLLSIVLFITAFLACFVFFVRNAFSQGVFEDVIDATVDVWSEKFDDTEFTNAMRDDYGIRINDKNIVEFFEESTAKEFIAGKLAEFGDAFFDGENELVFSSNEIEDFLNENKETIEEVYDEELTKDEIKDISKMVVGDSHEYVITLDDFADIDEFDEVIDLSTNAFSYTTMTILIIISAAIILLLVLNSRTMAACGIGVNCILIGSFFILFALVALVVAPAVGLIETTSNGMITLMGVEETAVSMVLTIGAAAIKSMFPLAIVLLVGGIALLVIRKVVLSKQTNKADMSSYN